MADNNKRKQQKSDNEKEAKIQKKDKLEGRKKTDLEEGENRYGRETYMEQLGNIFLSHQNSLNPGRNGFVTDNVHCTKQTVMEQLKRLETDKSLD